MDKLIERLRINRFRVTLTANVNLYHVSLTCALLFISSTPKISSFRFVLSITYVLDCFSCTFQNYFCRFT